MTETQKAQITEMRRAGAGYGKIAQELGLSENTVKSYCRRYKSLPLPPPAGDSRHCQECGRPISQTAGRKPKKFCSDACRMKWWNSHLNLVKRKAIYRLTCQHCGKVFSVYGQPRRKYCSHACYIAERFGDSHDA